MKFKVTPETVIRTVVLAVALVNQVLTAMGKNPLPVADTQVYELLTLLATIGASVWAWWKNNSFTPEALEADWYMKYLKAMGREQEGED